MPGRDGTAFEAYDTAVMNKISYLLARGPYETVDICDMDATDLRHLRTSPFFRNLTQSTANIITAALVRSLQISRQFRIDAIAREVPQFNGMIIERNAELATSNRPGAYRDDARIRILNQEVSYYDQVIQGYYNRLHAVQDELAQLGG